MIRNIYDQIKEEGYWCDKGSLHSYIDTYDKLELYKRDIKSVLEIGVFDGGSLLMWRRCFPKASITGVDSRKWKNYDKNSFDILIKENNISFIQGNIMDEYTQEKLLGNKFDLIIDDASHILTEQLLTSNILIENLTNTGLYIIEDIKNLQDAYVLASNISDKARGNLYLFDNRAKKKRYDDIILILERVQEKGDSC